MLRPGGCLIMNERVWKATASQSEVDRVNAVSREVFGIHVATDRVLDGQAWLRLMHDAGLIDLSAEPVEARLPTERWRAPLSRRFKRQNHQYGAVFTHLECRFFSARKPT